MGVNILLPRGIRNNNPFNICKGPKYLGLNAVQNDSRFCQFKDMLYGCRAMWKLLVSYYWRFIEAKKPYTIRNIIQRFAPPNENDTDFYAQRVGILTGINIDEVLPNPEKASEPIIPIMLAMASIENGWSMEKIRNQLLTYIQESYALACPR